MAQDNIPAAKQCSKCRETKPRAEFCKESRSRDGLASACRACRGDQNKRWREDNANYIPPCIVAAGGKDAYAALRRRENPDSYKRSQAKFRATHAAELREKALVRQRAVDPARKRQVATARRLRKKDELNAQRRARYAANPEIAKEQVHRRRVRKRGSPGEHTLEQALEVLKEQEHRCANPLCRTALTLRNRSKDHIVALASNGSDNISNIQWLCKPCNTMKRDAEWESFLVVFAKSKQRPKRKQRRQRGRPKQPRLL